MLTIQGVNAPHHADVINHIAQGHSVAVRVDQRHDDGDERDQGNASGVVVVGLKAPQHNGQELKDVEGRQHFFEKQRRVAFHLRTG